MTGLSTAAISLAAFLLAKASMADSQYQITLGEELDLADFPDGLITAAFDLPITPADLIDVNTIVLPNGDVLKLEDVVYNDELGGYSTISYEGEGDSEADITVNDGLGEVTGSIKDKEGKQYEIEFLGDGLHAWLVMDLDKLEQMSQSNDQTSGGNVQSREMLPLENIKKLAAASRDVSDNDEIAELSVKVYFTKEYESKTSDIQGTVENILGTVNQAFINSDIFIRVNLHCIERYIGTEYYDAGAMWGNFSAYKGYREILGGSADLILLLVENSNVCGMGHYWTTWHPISLAQKWCAESYYTVTHEFGHNLGAHHDAATVGDADYFGRGYLLPNSTKRTNMAYDADGKHWDKLNYYSDDVGVDKDGDRLGTVDADNSRVLNERRFEYVDIGDESQTCTENFEPDMTEGVIEWSDWENFGCYDDPSKPMKRTAKCLTEYFECTAFKTGDTQEITCECPNKRSAWGECEYWRDVGYCEHTWVDWMDDNCPFTCDTCGDRAKLEAFEEE